MSENWIKTVDPAVLTDRFIDIFMNKLVEEIDSTEIEIEKDFAEHQFKAKSYEEQDRVQTLNIRYLIGEAVYRIIKFDRTGLSVWADRAKKFFELNGDHPSFSSTFANDLNYQAIILANININYNSDIIRKIFAREISESWSKRVKPIFSDQLRVDIDEMISRSIIRSLESLAIDLKSGEISKFKRSNPKKKRSAQRVKSEPSFRDQTGAIRFSQYNNRLIFVAEKPKRSMKAYKKLVDRAVSEIERVGLVKTLSNISPDISRITKEYLDEFYRELDRDEDEGARAIALCVIGGELYEALRNNSESHDKSEIIDGEPLRVLNALVGANSVYVQAFPSVFEYMESRERAEDSYRRLNDSEKRVPLDIFSNLVKEKDLFEPRTLEALKKIEKILKVPEDKRQKNAIGLSIAALRGALHEMGSIIVEQELSSIAKEFLKTTGMTATIVAFFKIAEHDVLALANSYPVFFYWIKIFIDFLKMQ